MKYDLERNYACSNQPSHLAIISHHSRPFGRGRWGSFYKWMIKYTYKRSKLLLTSLCDSSWYGRWSAGAGRGSLSKASVVPGCSAISPGLSPQRAWAVHTHKLSSSSHKSSICVEHSGGAQMHPVEKGGLLCCPHLQLILWKPRTPQLGNFALPGSTFPAPCPAAREHRGHFPALSSIMRASG